MRSLFLYLSILLFGIFLSTEINAQALSILDISTTDETCSDLDDGTITISITGANKPYVYTIIRGAFSRTSGLTSDTIFTFAGVYAGNWIVLLEDAASTAVLGNGIVDQPDPVTITSTLTTPISCNGFEDGTITVNASGESESLIYTLNPGAISFNVTGVFTGLIPGTYNVTVTDASGCTSTDDTGPVTFTDPLILSVNSATATDISCNGLTDGVINVRGSGGTGGYVYTLNPGLIVNGSGDFTGRSADTYTVTITDDNSCPSVDTPPLTINEPVVLTGSILSQTDVLCFGASTGSVTIQEAGGTGPFEYKIDGGVFDSSPTINGLAAGNYTARVKDAKGCIATVVPDIEITQPATAVSGIISAQTNISCNGSTDGSVTIDGSNGTAPYSYNIDGGGFVGSGTFNGLSVGLYTLKVMDDNGCISPDVVVDITQPDILTGSITAHTDISCNGLTDGTITVTPAGGTAPYSYILNEIPLNITGAASGIFTGLPKDTYTVDITDNNGCSVTTASQTVSEPEGKPVKILVVAPVIFVGISLRK